MKWRIIRGRLGTRSVSPVIGVVLMVAITVLLAATAAAMFFGMADSQQSTPTIAMSENVDHQSVQYTFDGGDAFDPDEGSVLADVVVRDSSTGATTTASFDTSLTGAQTRSDSVGGTTVTVEYDPAITGSQVSAGDSFAVELNGAPSNIRISESDTSVVWESDGRSSATLYSSSEEDVSSGSGGGGPAAPSISATTQYENNNPGDNSIVNLWVTNIDGGSEIVADDIQIEVEMRAENPNTGATETVTKSQPQPGWTAVNQINDWDPEFTTLHGSGNPYLSYGTVTNTEWSARSTAVAPHLSFIVYETGNPTTIDDYRITLTHEPTGQTIYQESTF